jgi:23S rRNA pseudouridine1911/1915/1917 synthase
MPLAILHEDNHLICVMKPAGQLTQGDRSGSISLLDSVKEYIKIRDNKPGNVFLGMVQRLDKPVSGVIVFAKTSKAASRLSESIRNREVDKCYLAITATVESKGLKTDGWQEHRHYMRRRKDTTLICREQDAGAQLGVLRLKTIHVGDRHGCHLIRLITGRKHQIRVQLAHLGMVIAGDARYGSQDTYWAAGIGLHALSLELTHPVKKEVLRITSEPPSRFFSCFNERERTAIYEAIQSEK